MLLRLGLLVRFVDRVASLRRRVSSYRHHLSPRRRLPVLGRLLATETLEPRLALSASVPAYRNDIDGADTGVNANEQTLTPVNVVTGSFAKQFSTSVDGQVLAQPLYMAGVTITAPGTTGAQNIVYTAPGSAGVHNVTFVATEHDSLYAIDANGGAVLWQDSFINGTTVTTVPSADVNSGDISPEIGITGTPAIDATTGYLYVVTKSKQFENGDTVNPHYVNTLYKVNIQNGTDTSVVIADTTYSSGSFTYNSGPYVLGSGSGAINVGGQSRVYFNSLRQMFRPAVEISNGQVLLASASHGDSGPYHGWMLTYNENTLALSGVLNVTPNGSNGGVWGGGAPIAVDPQGNFYLETGNGSFNQSASNFPTDAAFPAGDTSLLPIDGDYGDSFIKIAVDPTTTQSNMNVNGWGLKVVDYFTPEDQSALNSADEDLGSGAPIVLPASVGSAAHPQLIVGGGKEGKLYLIDSNHMGGFSTTDAGAVQTIGGAVGGILSAPAYFNGEIYYTGGYSGGISAFSIANGVVSNSAISTTSDSFGNLDGGPMISAAGTVNGIVWALDRGTGQLRAYDASNLTKELYTSAQAANNADAVGSVMKFTSPLVANGQVFVGTGNSLVVYGLPMPATTVPAAPTNLTATAPVATEITLKWTDNSGNETAFNILRSTDGVNWTQVGAVGTNVTTYNDTTVQSLTTYYYEVQATNVIGVSAFTNVASATTPGAQSIGTGDGLLGQYYPGTNINFATSTPTATRVDPTINFNWSTTGPVAALGTTNYSVRWTGQLQAQYSQAYTFSTNSDDAIRVILNGQTIINDYTAHASKVDTSSPISLIAGQNYSIEIDYFQAGGLAQASLSWSSATTAQQIIPQSQLFSGVAPNAPVLAPPTAASGTQLNLAWTESSVNETGFEIDRKVGVAGTYAIVAVVGPAVTSYMDSSLSPNTNYYYRIRALNFGANSPYSNEVNLTTPLPPATPSNGQPTLVTTNEIDFSWQNNASDATVTRILRNSGVGGNFIFVAAVSPSTTTYADHGPNGAGLTPGVSYDYHIQVANVAGYSDFTGFVVQTLTTPPTQLNAVPANGRMTLVWNAPTGALSYNVYRSTTSNGEGATPIATGVSSNTFVDTNVTNGTTYYYQVTAVDTGGESAHSAESSATPQVASATSPPPGGLVTTVGDGKLSLSWSPASGATAYNIYRSTASGTETLLKSGVTALTYVDTGLTDGTAYYYQVSSVNAVGEGGRSSEVSAVPQIVAPLTPINVQATASDGQVALTWSAAADAQSYNIYRSTDDPGDEVLYQQGVVGTSLVDTGVTDGVTYYYQVSAANGVGESNLSAEVSGTPLPPLPATPTALSATSINDAQIRLQWQESSAGSSFIVNRSANGGSFSPMATLDPGVTTYVDSSGLLPGITYSYQVIATNLAGNSAISTTASAALLGKLSPPWTDSDIGGPSAAGSAYFSQNVLTVAGSGVDSGATADQLHFAYQTLNGNGSIVAEVLSQGNTSALAKAGVMIRNTLDAGSAFADMVLTPSSGAEFQTRLTANGAASNVFATGYAAPEWVELTRNGTTITGFVSSDGVNWTQVGTTTISLNTQVYIGLAANSNVQGTLSSAIFHGISVNGQGTPTAPSNLNSQILSGDSASLTWATTDTSAFGENVYRQNPGNSTYVLVASLPSNATSFTDTGLVSGGSYSYYVTATNTVGASAASNAVLVTTPLLPTAPSELQPNQITTTSAGLSWQLNSSNDTGVYVYRSLGSTNAFSLIATLPAGSTTYADSALQPGTVYQYEVAAFNSAGSSAVAETGLTTLPTAPTGLSASAGNGQVTLNWTASNGALAYNVYRGLSPGAENASAFATGISSTSFVDRTANANTTYYYKVTAVDFSGESALSNEVSSIPTGTLTAPAVTTNPTSQSVSAGSTVTFTAAASGNPTPTVQWQVSTNGGTSFTNVAGATSLSYSFSATAAQTANQYRAVFTNSQGTATSSAATLTVSPALTAPVVTTSPTSQSVTAGSTVTFTAAASGNPTPTVQWQVSTNGGTTFTNLAGATSLSYSFSTTTAQTGNQYRAVFTNSQGTATSSTATLTVSAAFSAPVVTTNPTNQTVTPNGTVTFTAAASGNPTPTIQWQVSADGGVTFVIVAGFISNSLSFVAPATANGYQVQAVFTNSQGTTTSAAATLTVSATTVAPVVTTNPTSQSVAAGSTVTFSAAVSGNPTPTVQWQVSTNGGTTFTNLAGATSLSYSFSTMAAQTGNQYRAVFTNSQGTATSSAATLTVSAALTAPVVTTNPTSQSVTAGSTVTFTAAASGNPTPTVQWQVSTNGGTTFTNVAGATSLSYSFSTTAAQTGNKYRAVFTNSQGTATSSAGTLTVSAALTAPAVTTNPTSQSVTAGSTVAFTAAASGNPTPTVQWQVSTNGGTTFSNVVGATSLSYSFSTTAAQTGNKYRAAFTNSQGTATSSAATLTVSAALTAPVVTTNPTSQSVTAGSMVTFTAAASGNPTPTIQWQVSADGGVTYMIVAGFNSNSLSFVAPALANGYQIQALFTNSQGTTTSAAAILTVTGGAAASPAVKANTASVSQGTTAVKAVEPSVAAAPAAPIVTLNPTDQRVSAGSTVAFAVAASGSPATNIQWQVSINGSSFTNIAGATLATYSFKAASDQSGSQYRAVFTSLHGTAVTKAASLTVTAAQNTVILAGVGTTRQPSTQVANAVDRAFGSSVSHDWLS